MSSLSVWNGFQYWQMQIVDVLSIDQAVSVRLAVYEGMQHVVHCPNAVNACDRALKCLFDKKGINDRSDRVRLASFQLLNALKSHRFIKVYRLCAALILIYKLIPNDFSKFNT